MTDKSFTENLLKFLEEEEEEEEDFDDDDDAVATQRKEGGTFREQDHHGPYQPVPYSCSR
jgi:hypothetical protein